MWTKIKTAFGILGAIAGFLLIALIGVGVFFVAAFFFWGIIGLVVIMALGAIIYDIISPTSDSPTD